MSGVRPAEPTNDGFHDDGRDDDRRRRVDRDPEVTVAVNSFSVPGAEGFEEVPGLAGAGVEWSVQDQLFSVAGTRTVAGRECTVVRTDRKEPWGTRSVFDDTYSYGEDGVLLEVELVSYESG